mgnify:CR=1 FL=1
MKTLNPYLVDIIDTLNQPNILAMKPIILDILVKANKDLGFPFNETDAHEMYLVFKKYEDDKEKALIDILNALEPNSVDLENNHVGDITVATSANNNIDKAICQAIKVTNYQLKK